MSTQALRPLIGTVRSYITAHGLTFSVSVRDARTVFGRTDVLVSPVSGSGERWVSLDSTTPKEG